MATKDIILFQGDDIQPANEQFFRAHCRLHGMFPDRNFAVLGKVVFPRPRHFTTNFVMEHVQGKNGEQFGYANLTPCTFVDYRFFYTCNVSVKHSLVENWEIEGFSKEFSVAAFDDIEFGYRVSTKGNGLKIFYEPTSLGIHYHPYTLDSFFIRQVTTGMMARQFISLHPESADVLGVCDYVRLLRLPTEPDQVKTINEFLLIIDELKSYVRNLELTKSFGDSYWHKSLLSAIFELGYVHGFLTTYNLSSANVAAAYRHAIGRWGRLLHEMAISNQRASTALYRSRFRKAVSWFFSHL